MNCCHLPVSEPLSILRNLGSYLTLSSIEMYNLPTTSGSEVDVTTERERSLLEKVSIKPYIPKGKVQFWYYQQRKQPIKAPSMRSFLSLESFFSATFLRRCHRDQGLQDCYELNALGLSVVLHS